MKEKKIPERTCIACRTPKPKNELIRIVRTPEGEIMLDPTGKRSGRGAYICRSEACFKRCKKAKQLSRALGAAVDDAVYDALLEEIRGLE